MRLRTTHSATVYGERVVGEDALGTDRVETDAPIASIDGRHRPQGEGLTREQRSERIDESPTFVTHAVGRDPGTGEQVQLLDELAPGQRVDIDGVTGTFELVRVVPHYGRGSTAERITLELERTDG